MAKKKKLLKKLAKAALIGGGLYAATRGLKGRADKLTEGDIGAGLSAPVVEDAPYISKKVKVPKFTTNDPHQFRWPNKAFKGGGIAKRGMGAAFKKGGRVKSMGIAKRGGGAAKR